MRKNSPLVTGAAVLLPEANGSMPSRGCRGAYDDTRQTEGIQPRP